MSKCTFCFSDEIKPNDISIKQEFSCGSFWSVDGDFFRLPKCYKQQVKMMESLISNTSRIRLINISSFDDSCDPSAFALGYKERRRNE